MSDTRPGDKPTPVLVRPAGRPARREALLRAVHRLEATDGVLPSLIAGNMLDSLTELVTASGISYLVIVGFVWLDAWFPVVPGESLVLTGAVLAAQAELSIWLVLLAGFAGAIAGDNFTYLLGSRIGTRATDKLFRSEKNRNRLAWAQDELERRRWIILVSRFIPGGRTAVMFASGTFALEWKTRFLPFELAGAVLWTSLTAALGYFFGSAFQDSVWLPLLISFAVAAAITVIAELIVRRTRRGRAADRDEEATPAWERPTG